MKKLTLISALCLLLITSLSAQVVRSGKVTIHINNKPLPVDIKTDNIIIKPADNDIYGKYYALVIGINNYTDPAINKLDKLIRDAELFYNLIITRYTFEKDNVRFLRDAKMAEITNALDSLAKKIGPADNFLIFYAGQGYWDSASEAGFWLPSDAQGIGYWVISSDEKENTKLAWFSNRLLGDYLRKINSKHTLLIAEACFGGPLFNARSVSGNAKVEFNKLNELTGRKAMTSGISSSLTEQSDFFKYLFDRLEINTEKYLPSEKLFISFPKPVSNNTNMIPRFGEINTLGDEGGDFIFILKD
jgi:hypothetical protein